MEIDMFKRLITSALLFGMAATAPPAHAVGCAPRDQIVTRLADDYSEALTAAGLQSAGESAQALMEIWSNPSKGTYTVLLTVPSGISCVVAIGSDFFTIDPETPPSGEES